MIDRILAASERSTFDFRIVAHPRDPLRHLWDDWIDYYRLKAAIAEVLRPASILEIGVRYGYSAAAFLHGAPHARFTGIDLDSASFGGEVGAIEWARQILPPDRVTLVVGNSQTMEQLPGGLYDLIHIDGQQDGDGTFHDLSLAIRQARFILLDGYLWSRNNFQAANEFLHLNRLAIHSWSVVPNYAGELLIEVRPALPDEAAARNQDYYLRDLPGAAGYLDALHGAPVPDPDPVLSLALANQPTTLLDLGCGRGELARAAADRGCRVSAIDRSSVAIELTTALAQASPEPIGSVTPVHGDFRQRPWDGDVDCIVAAEVLPELTDAETDTLLAAAARALRPEGRLVIQTSANAWYWHHHYRALRGRAHAEGHYLAPDPRTFHQRQLGARMLSPARLRRHLRRYFAGVAVWVGCRGDPVAALTRRFARADLVAQPEIYAVAAHVPLDRQKLAEAFAVSRLESTDDSHLALRILRPPQAPAGRAGSVYVELHNGTNTWLTSHPACPIHLSYHLFAASGELLRFEGLRTRLSPPLAPGARGIYRVQLAAPANVGTYHLQVTLVQEAVRWMGVRADTSFEVIA